MLVSLLVVCILVCLLMVCILVCLFNGQSVDLSACFLYVGLSVACLYVGLSVGSLSVGQSVSGESLYWSACSSICISYIILLSTGPYPFILFSTYFDCPKYCKI